MAVVQKVESMLEDVMVKVHRHSDDQLILQEKMGDIETKIILLIQAAKNSSEGKDNSHIFDGIGEVVTAVDHFKDMMKGQYAKLSEYKETETQVETLNRFYRDYQDEKRRELKEKDALQEKIEDIKILSQKLQKEVTHIKEERFKLFENQLLEKLDYNEFEQTIMNIQNYVESLGSGDSSDNFRVLDSLKHVPTESEGALAQDYDSDEENVEERRQSPKRERPTVNTGPNSRDTTPNEIKKTSSFSRQNSISPPKGIRDVSAPATTLVKRPTLKRKKTLKKTPSFIPKDAARLRELERRLKEVDEKITNVLKNSKNEIIPVIEKRLDGIREELENKASTLDVKKLIPELTYNSETNKKINEEMKSIRESPLFGEKGKKIEEDLSLTISKLAQLDGKFTWLHTSHKDLIKKMHESINASQPLMMNTLDLGGGTISDAVVVEIKEEIEKLQREVNSINANFKLTVQDLKQKIGEKVDDRALNQLEDQLTTDIDQTIRSKHTLYNTFRF